MTTFQSVAAYPAGLKVTFACGEETYAAADEATATMHVFWHKRSCTACSEGEAPVIGTRLDAEPLVLDQDESDAVLSALSLGDTGSLAGSEFASLVHAAYFAREAVQGPLTQEQAAALTPESDPYPVSDPELRGRLEYLYALAKHADGNHDKVAWE